MAQDERFTTIFERMKKVAEDSMRNNLATHLIAETVQPPVSEDERLSKLNEIVKAHGFMVPTDWFTLDAGRARKVLRKTLTDSTAYDRWNIDNVHESTEADVVVADFFALFDPAKTLFVTTNNFDGDGNRPTSLATAGPLTNATFESGLAAFDGQTFAMILLEEED